MISDHKWKMARHLGPSKPRKKWQWCFLWGRMVGILQLFMRAIATRQEPLLLSPIDLQWLQISTDNDLMTIKSHWISIKNHCINDQYPFWLFIIPTAFDGVHLRGVSIWGPVKRVPELLEETPKLRWSPFWFSFIPWWRSPATTLMGLSNYIW